MCSVSRRGKFSGGNISKQQEKEGVCAEVIPEETSVQTEKGSLIRFPYYLCCLSCLRDKHSSTYDMFIQEEPKTTIMSL